MTSPTRSIARLLTSLLTGLLFSVTLHAATRIDLDSGWRFRTESTSDRTAPGVVDGVAAGWPRAVPNGTQPVAIPHTWNVGAEADFEGTGWYFRSLELPAALGATAHVELNFGATFYNARVWLNGVAVGAHEGGHTAWAVDISRALRRDGPNLLAVAIDNRPSARSIPGHAMRLAASRNVWYDWWHHGGMTREVWLEVSDGVLIRRQTLNAELPADLSTRAGPAQVTARIEVENTGASDRHATLVSTVYAPDGSVAASARRAVALPAGTRQQTTLPFTIAKPVLWNVGDGQLYQVTTELRDADPVAPQPTLDTRSDTLGLRRIELRDRQIWVNGRPMRLTGLTRHADSPWEGGAETRGTWLHDWQDLRALHTTLTRPVHYPQSPAVLDYADRHGILLVPEIPIWQFSEAQLQNPRVLALAQKMMAEVIAADGNHPSIFAWSVCNECDAKLPGGLAYFRAMKAFVRAADPTRFVTFADSDLSIAPWPDSAAAHEADFIMANAYFGTWSGAAESVEPWLDFMDRTYPDKALVISEYGFPGPFARNPVEADQQRIANMRQQLDAFAKRPFVAGAIFWTYQDYRSHQNQWAGETAGHVEHGVVDENRQRKPSYAAYEQRHVPLRHQLSWQSSDAGLGGFRAVLQRNDARQLPSYPLAGHRVEWRMQDRDGGRVAEGAQPLPDLETPFVLQGSWPARKDLTDAVLRLRVIAPDGAVALDTRLAYETLRFNAAASAVSAAPASAPAVAAAPAASAASAPTIPLVPWPAELHATGDAGARLAQGAVIAVPAGDAGARRVANSLAAMAARDRGLRLVVRNGTRGAIVLQRTKDDAAAESYRLEVTATGVTLAAGSDAGLFYASISLWQLLTADAARGPVTLPALRIDDTPRFGWRGLMLDVVRHFMPLADVKAMVDQMAQHKLNVLHLHLSDDQGWRIEIKRFPALTQVGAWRQPPGGEPARYGGFYTQAELRELVAYAAARHIQIVPELDMPGHAQAVVAAYPQLGVDIDVESKGDPGRNPRPAVSVDWGVNPYLYNVEDATLRFIEQVLDEVIAVFPSPFIHVGGDEAIKDQWKASPTVQARMKALGLKNEEALQGWFIERVGNYLAAHGRRLIGWDEILEGGLPPGASVMSWRGSAGAVAAAKLGHDVVLAPAGSLYFDYQQSDAADEPAGRVALLPIENVYHFEPVSAELDANQVKHVLGLEATLWSEYMPTRARIEHAVFPRLAALAEVAWSPKAARDWRGFVPRLAAQRARYLRQGVNAADSAFAVRFAIDGGRAAMLAAGQAPVRLSNQIGFGAIHYTLDGSEPTPASPRADTSASPLTLPLGARVRATAFDTDGAPLARVRERRLDTPSLLRLSSAELQACPGSDLGLRLPLRPEAEAWAPVFNVSLLDACWIYPQARLDGIGAIGVDAGRLARNYGLAHEAVKVVQYPPTTPGGELEVRDGGCGGPVLVRMPLPDGASLQTVHFFAPLPAPLTGTRDLCLRFTAPISGPLWAIDAVQLQPSAPPTSR